jgi:hypothetical protein
LSSSVGDECQYHVPRRHVAGARPAECDGQHRRVHRLHVQRAAAPHCAIANLTGERVDAPVLLRGGDDVEVTVHEQCRGGPVAAGDADDGAGASGLSLDHGR